MRKFPHVIFLDHFIENLISFIKFNSVIFGQWAVFLEGQSACGVVFGLKLSKIVKNLSSRLNRRWDSECMKFSFSLDFLLFDQHHSENVFFPLPLKITLLTYSNLFVTYYHEYRQDQGSPRRFQKWIFISCYSMNEPI